MLEIDLKEYQQSGPLQLTAAQVRALQSSLPSINVAPTGNADGEYLLTPGSTVGALEVGELSVLIEPKIGIPQLLSLACYAISRFKPQDEMFEFPREYALPDVLALALAASARQAFSRGLLHGYRVEEEALYTVRGRIMIAEQLRTRFGIPLPIEVRYDEFTNDILANQIVKAAVYRLGRMRLRSLEARRQLGRIAGMLENVSLEDYSPRNVPDVPFDRLNEHYRGVVSLSRLILQHGAFESSRGEVRASGFLMDMNVVFQEFVTVALREALGVSANAFGERTIPSLDLGRQGEPPAGPGVAGRRPGRLCGRREVQENRRSRCPKRRPVSTVGLYDGFRFAGRPADIRRGRGRAGDLRGPKLRQEAGGGRARFVGHA